MRLPDPNHFWQKSAPTRSHRRRSNVSHVLVSAGQIQQRVGELARRISQVYANTEGLLFVGILRGAFIFLADLTRQLSVHHTVDFMALSSYGNNTTIGQIRLLMDLRELVEGQHVVIVDDIVDSGLTLDYVYRHLQSRRPASLHTCILVRKRRSRQNVPIDYLGFEVPDTWLVGYGLDHAGEYRTLPYIAEFKDLADASQGQRLAHPAAKSVD